MVSLQQILQTINLSRLKLEKKSSATTHQVSNTVNPIPARGGALSAPPLVLFFVEPRKMKIRPANGLTNPS